MTDFDREIQAALLADGEKLRQMTGEDHGPYFIVVDPTLQSERDDLLAAVKKVVSHNGWSATEIRDVVALIARCDERDARGKETG